MGEIMKIIGILDCYKTASAFFTAYDIGLFDMLYELRASTEIIAQKLTVDVAMCKLLLYKLKESQWICGQDNLWYLEEEFREEYPYMKSYKAQIDHEMNIYNRLMSPELIVKSLKSEYGQRPFDKTGFTLEEQETYNQAMYGENVQLIGLQMFRMLRNRKEINGIEIGRSNGVLVSQLKKLGLKFETAVVTNDVIPASNQFNVVILFNTIHYWDEAYCKKQFAEWKKNLTEDAQIFIIDFFYEDGDKFTSNILIDWITHGGIYWSVYTELNDRMEQSGYKIIKNLPLKKIHTRILQYQRDTSKFI
jgi:hypothetical protein